MTGESSGGTLEFSIVNDLRDIAGAGERIGAFCAEHGLAEEVSFEVHLALEELLTNTIDYGYDNDNDNDNDNEHRIDLLLRLQGDTLTVEIADDGGAFEPLQAAEPDMGASLEDRARGGLGIFLVRKMMDSVAYRRQDGRNVVTLTKRVATGKAP